MLKLSSLAKFLEQTMYKDRMDVYRLKTVENEGLTYQNIVDPIPIYKNVPCRISNNFKDLPEEDSYMINPTNQHLSVFCNPELVIEKGDKLIIHRLDDNGAEFELLTQFAGKPNREINHQEISLVDREYA